MRVTHNFFYIKNERIGRIDFLKFCMADPSHVILIMNGKNVYNWECNHLGQDNSLYETYK